jgi:hypothetical protein
MISQKSLMGKLKYQKELMNIKERYKYVESKGSNLQLGERSFGARNYSGGRDASSGTSSADRRAAGQLWQAANERPM